MEKLAIWIIGGSGVGKTTLAAEIHKFIAETTGSKYKPQVVGWGDRDKEFAFTQLSKFSANLGTFGFRACGGTDSLSTKDRISASYLEAIKHYPIVIIEGIMATSKWYDWIRQAENTKLFLIHLEISPEENFRRLKKRRSDKTGELTSNIILRDSTKENLTRKLMNFRNLYRKTSLQADYRIQIHADVLDQKRTADVVKQYMIDHILG